MAKKATITLDCVHLHDACVSFYMDGTKVRTYVHFYEADVLKKVDALKILQGGVKPKLLKFDKPKFTIEFKVAPMVFVFFDFKYADYKEIFEALAFSVAGISQEKHNELLSCP